MSDACLAFSCCNMNGEITAGRQFSKERALKHFYFDQLMDLNVNAY